MLKFAVQFTEEDLYLQCNSPQNGSIITAETPDNYSLTPLQDSVTVPPENKKPELGGSGRKAEIGGLTVPTILASNHISGNSNEYLIAESAVAYTCNGYIRLPRSLLDHPGYAGAHAIHRIVLLKIIELAGWHERQFNDQGHILNIGVGEVCISVRQLAEECGKGCSKHWVTGAISVFTALSFLGQRVGHQRLILKVTHRDTYELIKNVGRTASRTEVGQQSDTNEDHKNIKKRKEKSEPTASAVDNADALRLCFLFIETLSKTLPLLKPPENLNRWQLEFDRMLRLDKRDPHEIELVLGKMPGHWYSKNIQSAATFRQKFPLLVEHAKEKNSAGDVAINRNHVKEVKKKYAAQLKDWTLSGDYVINNFNSKELSLKMKPKAFEDAFLTLIGAKHAGT